MALVHIKLALSDGGLDILDSNVGPSIISNISLSFLKVRVALYFI